VFSIGTTPNRTREDATASKTSPNVDAAMRGVSCPHIAIAASSEKAPGTPWYATAAESAMEHPELRLTHLAHDRLEHAHDLSAVARSGSAHHVRFALRDVRGQSRAVLRLADLERELEALGEQPLQGFVDGVDARARRAHELALGARARFRDSAPAKGSFYRERAHERVEGIEP
jgi:hypothetical protein